MDGGVEHRGPKGDATQEVRAQLTESAVKDMMTDSLVDALTEVHSLQPSEDLFMITLCARNGNFEYMHPGQVKTLDNWQLYFVDCGLLNNIDFTSGMHSFPVLMAPSSATPFLVTYFTLAGQPFSVTVTHAPLSVMEGRNSIVIHAVSPKLPCTYGMLEARFGRPSQRRKRAMLQHAMVAMAEGVGFSKINDPASLAGAAADAAASIEDNLLSRLTLEHGEGLIDMPGVQAFEVGGIVYSHAREKTAGSVVIPLVLRHLHFLRFVIGGPVMYHIKAVSKYAYMIHFSNVGGWKLFVQVNMNASLLAVQQWFSSPNMCTTCKHFATIALPPSRYPRCDEGKLYELMDECKRARDQQSTAAADMPKDQGVTVEMMEQMPPKRFITYMQSQGLEMLQCEKAQNGARQKEDQMFAEGQNLLKNLLFRNNRKIIQPTQAIACLYEALEGIVDHVWDSYKAKAADLKEKIIPKFNCDIGEAPKLIISEDLLRTILISCQDTPPSSWWVVAKAATKAQHAHDIIRMIFMKPNTMQSLLPVHILFEPNSRWIDVVQSAASTHASIAMGRRSASTLKSKKLFDELIKKAREDSSAAVDDNYDTGLDELRNTFVGGIAFMALCGDKVAFQEIGTK